MTKRYAVERTIDASPERVWSLLTDPATYPDWNPAVVSIAGPMEVGGTVRLVSVVNPKRAFTLKVTEMDAPHRMVWSDGMPLGLFRGVRTYTLHQAGADRTEFAMEEVFTGPLAPLITKAIPDMTESFALFADGLKRGSESGRP